MKKLLFIAGKNACKPPPSASHVAVKVFQVAAGVNRLQFPFGRE
jgi:hypothetical protein